MAYQQYLHVDSLYSNLKAMIRPLDTKHKKAAFEDNKNKIINDYPITLIVQSFDFL